MWCSLCSVSFQEAFFHNLFLRLIKEKKKVHQIFANGSSEKLKFQTKWENIGELFRNKFIHD